VVVVDGDVVVVVEVVVVVVTLVALFILRNMGDAHILLLAEVSPTT